MRKLNALLLGLIISLFLITSCKDDDDDDPVNESQVLVEYLESAAMKDYANTSLPSIIKADEVKSLNATNSVYIIDIREAADFDAGHIPNANNVALGDILTHLEGADHTSYSKIAVVCYTGQTAGFATTLLQLSGYENAYSLKWGMCSWDSVFAETKWLAKTSNAYATQFTTDVTEKGAEGELPELNTGKTTGAEILAARISAILAEGFGPAKIDNKSVFDNSDNYYIVNYWKQEHYDIGHIPGAIQYTPKESLKLSESLKTLPKDGEIVVYCYTGQTSAFMSAYLRILGYNAKSLLFGANGMIYDIMVENGMTTFSESQIHGYEYE